MNIFLCRHAEAKSEAEDLERGLTERGAADTGRVAEFLSWPDNRPGRIFHSPKKRAAQTAAIISQYLKSRSFEADGLAPGDEPQVWRERISKMEDDFMLVGHLPHLSRLASLLISGDPDEEILDFQGASVVCLGKKNGKWEVEWMVTPELIKKIPHP